MMRACGRAYRFPLVPAAASMKHPMLAAKPMQMVLTGEVMCFIVSYIARPADTLPPGQLRYTLMSFPGLSASRKSSCAMTTFATSSSISVPRKMMRSMSSRENTSYVRSPRLERSMIEGMKMVGTAGLL